LDSAEEVGVGAGDQLGPQESFAGVEALWIFYLNREFFLMISLSLCVGKHRSQVTHKK
jgi:hypothetical protein